MRTRFLKRDFNLPVVQLYGQHSACN
jgi:hypothetical protein